MSIGHRLWETKWESTFGDISFEKHLPYRYLLLLLLMLCWHLALIHFHHFARLVSQIEQGWWKEVPLTCALVIWRPQGLVGEVDWRWLKPPWNAWYIFFSVNRCNYFCPQNWGISGVLMAVICGSVFQEDILIEIRVSSLWAKVLPGSQESLVSLVLQQ